MKVAFLDRDGVINENRSDYVKAWEEFVFLPGALDALRVLQQAGWTTVVITNQAVIHRNIVPQSVVDEINYRMSRTVEYHGGHIDAVLYCPHRPEEGCGCRKPQPGLLLRAAQRFGLQLDRCYLIGDALTDIAAGRAVGCRCALVQTGRGRQQLIREDADCYGHYHVATDLTAAVQWMLWTERVRTPRRMWKPTGQEISVEKLARLAADSRTRSSIAP